MGSLAEGSHQRNSDGRSSLGKDFHYRFSAAVLLYQPNSVEARFHLT